MAVPALAAARKLRRMQRDDALALVDRPLDELMRGGARGPRRRARGGSSPTRPKVFIPLTKLCRDVCHYCTFARPPRRGERAYLTDRRGARGRARGRAPRAAARRCSRSATSRSCATARRARSWRRSAARRRSSTSRAAARLVLEETGLLPHLNPGVLTRRRLRALRPVAASMGLMLETTSDAALGARRPALRLAGQAAGARGSRRSRPPARRACRSRPGS